MESSDIEKIDKMIRDRKEAHQFLFHRSKTYDAFVSLAKEAFSAGELDKKTKELMAVGISIVINCEPCMEWHIHEALKAGQASSRSSKPWMSPPRWAAGRQRLPHGSP